MADGYVHEEIVTGVGEVHVDYSPVSGLTVTVWRDTGLDTRASTTAFDGDKVVTTVRFGRLPRVGEEVSQGGRSFEVTGVKELGDGSIHVRTDSGVWVRYEGK